MKFLLRCLLVLVIAAILGGVLYYAVQALPGGPGNRPPDSRLRPDGDRNAFNRTESRPERPENNSSAGVRWRSLLQIAWRVVMFSVLVFLSILAKNLVFGKRPGRKDSAD
jgi:hypothetical protein